MRNHIVSGSFWREPKNNITTPSKNWRSSQSGSIEQPEENAKPQLGSHGIWKGKGKEKLSKDKAITSKWSLVARIVILICGVHNKQNYTKPWLKRSTDEWSKHHKKQEISLRIAREMD